jgi:hypothetical protein
MTAHATLSSLTLSRTERKLLIARNDRGDLPHLTVSWGNLSHEIDIHLTSELPGGGRAHESVAKIPEQSLMALLTEFAPVFVQALLGSLDSLQRVRPGRLGRRGYLVLKTNAEAEKEWIGRLAPPRPKRPGKKRRRRSYSINEDFATDLQAHADLMISNWHHPKVLHDWAVNGQREPIWAVCTKRRRRGHTMVLMSLPLGAGRVGWFEMTAFGRKISRKLEEPAFPRLGSTRHFFGP